MSFSPLRRLAARPVWLRLLLVLVLAGTARLAWDLARHWPALHEGDALRFWLLLTLRCMALAAGLGAVAAAALREAPAHPAGVAEHELLMALRAVAYVMLSAIAIASLTQLAAGLGEDRFAVRSAFRSGLLLATSAWIFLTALRSRRPATASRGRAHWIGVVMVNLFLVLVAVEAVAFLFARVHPTRLLWNEGSAQEAVEANRLVPGTRYLGFTANSGGYYDDEFVRGGPDDLVVAVVTDSFGVGIVPHRHNFTTVLERRLARRAPVAGRVVVNNFGVPSIGLPEYAWLLENEVPETVPAKVVIGLFVGNDISALAGRPKRGYYSLQQFQLFELGRRLAALGRAGRLKRRAEPKARSRRGPALDPRRATFDEETFLGIERLSMEMCNTQSASVDRLYSVASEWLARLRTEAGKDPLVVLMPDEYQVNDELWDALLRRLPDPSVYDRRYPQKRLAGSCRELGIQVLDLLEPLRRASVERPVYGLRDTHWNVRGNRVAGDAIAEAVLAGWRAGRLPEGAGERGRAVQRLQQ